ncbi:hypothetical protein BH10BAC2_BH10BAC2_25890 [soil metagenome]
MKISKTLIATMMVAVTVGTAVSCTKSVDGKPRKALVNPKNLTGQPGEDSTIVTPYDCPGCGMG